MFDFTAWPPEFSKEQLAELTLLATAYALSHGLTYLPAEQQTVIPSAAIHAPFTLLPSPIPRRLFEKARRLQRSYHILYARVAMDVEFLDRVMGAEMGLGKVDSFIGQLWNGWKQLRRDGLAQPLQLGVFRSDYLLHFQPEADEQLTIKQVEFNTMSCAFGGLSPKTTALHRYLYSATKFFSDSPYFNPANFPDNDATAGLADGLALAHRAYGVNESQILFVVQPGERNVFDQRSLEYELLEKHSIKVIRRTFDELEHSASIDPYSSALKIKYHPDSTGNVEISTIYYRAGYSPTEYNAARYNTRFLLERSRAIKCPTIPLHLAGSKKVQEVLTQPGVLEHFLADKEEYGKDLLSQEMIAELRENFMEMWGLDVGGDMKTKDAEAMMSGKETFGIKKAREFAMSLVLKPQREGGGNNIYKEAIPEFLDRLPQKESQAWVAMQLIRPPDCGNYLVRAGSTDLDVHRQVKVATLSELGIFGWALFGGPDKLVDEREVGFLLRTKGKEDNEGGVATGFSVLDSVLLVD